MIGKRLKHGDELKLTAPTTGIIYDYTVVDKTTYNSNGKDRKYDYVLLEDSGYVIHFMKFNHVSASVFLDSDNLKTSKEIDEQISDAESRFKRVTSIILGELDYLAVSAYLSKLEGLDHIAYKTEYQGIPLIRLANKREGIWIGTNLDSMVYL